VSKRNRDRDEFASQLEAEFAAALEDEGDGRSQGRGRHLEHKTRQLCHQVQRALNLALTGTCSNEALESVFVIDVSPAPGCGHLLARVSIPEGHSMSAVLAELRALAPRLRAQVARSISRKRAPELSFAPGAAEEGRHD
jgi:ribosome-binding factor A